MAKYAGNCDYPSNFLSRDNFKHTSLWWKDLCALGKELENVQDWFWEFTKKRIGNGETTVFWHDIWIRTEVILPGNIVSLLEYVSSSSLGKKHREGLLPSFGIQ